MSDQEIKKYIKLRVKSAIDTTLREELDIQLDVLKNIHSSLNTLHKMSLRNSKRITLIEQKYDADFKNRIMSFVSLMIAFLIIVGKIYLTLT